MMSVIPPQSRLGQILSDASLEAQFSQFLAKTFASENYNFLKAVESFKRSGNEDEAFKIIERFLIHGAKEELHIDFNVRQPLIDKLDLSMPPEKDDFDGPLRAVVRYVEDDSARKFLALPEIADYLNKRQPRKPPSNLSVSDSSVQPRNPPAVNYNQPPANYNQRPAMPPPPGHGTPQQQYHPSQYAGGSPSQQQSSSPPQGPQYGGQPPRLPPQPSGRGAPPPQSQPQPQPQQPAVSSLAPGGSQPQRRMTANAPPGGQISMGQRGPSPIPPPRSQPGSVDIPGLPPLPNAPSAPSAPASGAGGGGFFPASALLSLIPSDDDKSASNDPLNPLSINRPPSTTPSIYSPMSSPVSSPRNNGGNSNAPAPPPEPKPPAEKRNSSWTRNSSDQEGHSAAPPTYGGMSNGTSNANHLPPPTFPTARPPPARPSAPPTYGNIHDNSAPNSNYQHDLPSYPAPSRPPPTPLGRGVPPPSQMKRNTYGSDS